MLPRPDLDDIYLLLARLYSLRSTCVRGTRGCVLVDGERRPVSAGHNGVPAGERHCTEAPCAGAADERGCGAA